jgi:hypothetical protein
MQTRYATQWDLHLIELLRPVRLQRMARSTCCRLENLGLVTPCPRLAPVFYLIEIYQMFDFVPPAYWAYGRVAVTWSLLVLSLSHSSQTPLPLILIILITVLILIILITVFWVILKHSNFLLWIQLCHYTTYTAPSPAGKYDTRATGH